MYDGSSCSDLFSFPHMKHGKCLALNRLLNLYCLLFSRDLEMTRSPSAGSLSALVNDESVAGVASSAAVHGTKVKEKLLLDEMHELLEEPVEEMVRQLWR